MPDAVRGVEGGLERASLPSSRAGQGQDGVVLDVHSLQSGEAGAIKKRWLECFRAKTPEIPALGNRSIQPSAPADAKKPRR